MAEPEGLTGGTPGPGQGPVPGAAPNPAAGSVAERLAQLPGTWGLAWWTLMRPISLHWWLKLLGVEPAASVRRLWRGDAVARAYLERMVLVLLVGTPTLAVAIGLLLGMGGVEVDWTRVAVGVVLGVCLGAVLGVVDGLLGVALSVALGVALGAAFGMPAGGTGHLVSGLVVGLLFRGAIGLGGGVTFGVVDGVVFGVGGSLVSGVFIGVVGGVAFGLAYFRLPVYLLEVPWQVIAYAIQRNTGHITLAASPILHHDLSYLPLPTLADHIRATAARDPALARRALTACEIAPGHRRVGQRALAMLRADELTSLVRDRRFESLRDLSGEWLPAPTGVAGYFGRFRAVLAGVPVNDILAAADGRFDALQDVGRFLRAAELTLIARQRQELLTAAADRLRGLDNALLGSRDLEAPIYRAALADWQRLVADWLAETAASAALEVPNPFRPQVPLGPEFGREVFRGREPLVAEIESILGDPGQGAALALIGPRRCGKTSLLNMLPLKLPDALVVFFDTQNNPIDSTGSLVKALVGQAQEQGRRERRLTLPDAPPGPPMEALGAWFERLERLDLNGAGVGRILLCIDEFERWEGLFPGDRRALLQLLGLLRATIQHRRRLRVLIAGAAHVDELDPMWADHLVNLRTLAIGPLTRSVTLDLLTRPSADFPTDAIPPAVAEAVWSRTLGQPYLTQLYGSLLVTRLNDGLIETGRRQATVADCVALDPEVLDKANTYLTNLVQSAPAPALAVLESLARGEPVDLGTQDRATRRYLHRRGLVGTDGGLGIPVLGAFLRRY